MISYEVFSLCLCMHAIKVAVSNATSQIQYFSRTYSIYSHQICLPTTYRSITINKLAGWCLSFTYTKSTDQNKMTFKKKKVKKRSEKQIVTVSVFLLISLKISMFWVAMYPICILNTYIIRIMLELTTNKAEVPIKCSITEEPNHHCQA